MNIRQSDHETAGARPNGLRVAILFPAEAEQGPSTRVERSRHAGTVAALEAVGLEVVGAPYADAFASHVRAQLRGVDGVLVWFNPFESGRDRSVLNAVLREAAAEGVMVSAHPDVIDKIGTKEVLYATRAMSWSSDTRLHASLDAMRAELPSSLASGPRVLKQIRGQSGDGVWKVEAAEPSAVVSSDSLLRLRHAKRGAVEERITLQAFLRRCEPYFAHAGGMIDQVYQPRLTDGMIRCYLVGGRIAGFGEQRINALYPAAAGAPADSAPQPGPRLYYPPTRPDFQALKHKVEGVWVDEMCRVLGLDKNQLPVIWDADFLYGPKDENGADTYVLCEINVSSVYPFPDEALMPLAKETLGRLCNRV